MKCVCDHRSESQSFYGLMNSIYWPALHVWVSIAQLVEHCSANAETTGSNPVEALFEALSPMNISNARLETSP